MRSFFCAILNNFFNAYNSTYLLFINQISPPPPPTPNKTTPMSRYLPVYWVVLYLFCYFARWWRISSRLARSKSRANKHLLQLRKRAIFVWSFAWIMLVVTRFSYFFSPFNNADFANTRDWRSFFLFTKIVLKNLFECKIIYLTNSSFICMILLQWLLPVFFHLPAFKMFSFFYVKFKFKTHQV